MFRTDPCFLFIYTAGFVWNPSNTQAKRLFGGQRCGHGYKDVAGIVWFTIDLERLALDGDSLMSGR